MHIFNRKRKQDTFDYEKYLVEYDSFLNYGKRIEDFISEIPTKLNEKQILNLTKKLYEFENVYLPDMDEEILFTNPQKLSEMITLKMVNNQSYLCLVFANSSYSYKTKYLCKIDNDTKYNKYYFIDLYKKYLEEKEKFNSMIFSGNKIIDEEINVDFLLSHSNQCCIKIFKNEMKIGHRLMEFSPFETFLRLGIFTINGATTVNDDYIGKGYGKILYDTVDDIFPYQQIPHGYEGSPYGLSDYSEAFWNKRDNYRKTPLVLEYYENQNVEINNLNNYLCGIERINPYSIYKPYLIEGFFLSQLNNINITWNKQNDIYLLNPKSHCLISFNNKCKTNGCLQELNGEQFRDTLINIINNSNYYKEFDWDSKKIFFEKKYPNQNFEKPNIINRMPYL